MVEAQNEVSSIFNLTKFVLANKSYTTPLADLILMVNCQIKKYC